MRGWRRSREEEKQRNEKQSLIDWEELKREDEVSLSLVQLTKKSQQDAYSITEDSVEEKLRSVQQLEKNNEKERICSNLYRSPLLSLSSWLSALA